MSCGGTVRSGQISTCSGVPLSVGQRQLAALPLRRGWSIRRSAPQLFLLPRFGLRLILTFLAALLLFGCGDTILLAHR
jgi:hypothetical protein